MSRYIDAEKTELELWDHGVNMSGEYQGVWVRFRDIEEVFKNVPTADVVEVVRCRDCIYAGAIHGMLFCSAPWAHGLVTNSNDYCSHGWSKKVR